MKLFILLSRIPYPTEKGDKLRAFHQIRILSEHHEITLCALSDIPAHPDAIRILQQYCKRIEIIHLGKSGMVLNVLKAFLSGKPIQAGYFYRASARRQIHDLIDQTKPDHIYCQLLRVADYVRDLNVPKTLDYQDVFSKGMQRRIVSSPWWKKALFRLEYHRLLSFEKEIFNDFDNKTIISAPDRELIPHQDNKEIVIIPNGVDHNYFSPMERPKTYDLVFTGNMGYPPNVDAAEFLANHIFPQVLKVQPYARLLIAGATPHSKVLALRSDNVAVSGWVIDIRESYASSKIFIAPMRIGTGLQNKLLEAMSMKLPCITSPLANSALGAKEESEILVGSSVIEYARLIIQLLGDKEFADKIAENGHSFVKDKYDWKKSTAMLEDLFKSNHQK
ncbi:MAG: glycosyltransferase [Bacteroidetes bacterium]|nr:glycosyltransferase [Bacteroidota bacterium]